MAYVKNDSINGLTEQPDYPDGAFRIEHDTFDVDPDAPHEHKAVQPKPKPKKKKEEFVPPELDDGEEEKPKKKEKEEKKAEKKKAKEEEAEEKTEEKEDQAEEQAPPAKKEEKAPEPAAAGKAQGGEADWLPPELDPNFGAGGGAAAQMMVQKKSVKEEKMEVDDKHTTINVDGQDIPIDSMAVQDDPESEELIMTDDIRELEGPVTFYKLRSN